MILDDAKVKAFSVSFRLAGKKYFAARD